MDTVPCPNCGKQNDPGDQICIHCGHALGVATGGSGPAASERSHATSAAPGSAETQRDKPGGPLMPSGLLPPPPPTAAPASNGVATAGMVLGILGVVLFWLPVVGFAMAIVAVVLGGVGLSRANMGGGGRGQAIAGLVLGVVGIAL